MSAWVNNHAGATRMKKLAARIPEGPDRTGEFSPVLLMTLVV
jgi:hypothetical protein